ncbi:MAG: hypothetical protein KDD12_12765, partial [Lewinella sp.]|nr:hypothetical protein [Lewinella sp.]
MLEGNRRFLGQLNHSAIDKTFNLQQTGGAGLCGADVAVFEAVKDAVRLLNGCDGGIAGGVARIWDNGWQLLGTTDASGIVRNQSLLSGNRRILMTLPNGDARDQTFAINWTPAYAVFNASNVSFHYCGNAEYKKGNQWLPLSNPTSLFQGSVQFRFDGIVKTIDLTGACNIDQTLVVFNLLNSGGGGQSGGNAQINAGGWKQADDQTDANGRLLAFFNGSLLGNRQLRMTYWAGDPGFLSTSASQTVNIGSTCNVTFQLADAHFRTWDGSSVVTEADGGDPNANVCVNSGGYKQLGILGTDGELHVDMFANNHQFKMGNYNYTSQVLTQNLNSNNVVDFGTRTMAIELRDENGNLVTSHDGTAYINSGGYKNLGTTAGTGIVDIALLYGNWQFKMEMNYSSQVKTVNISGGPAVMDARILPVQVLDENHIAIENVTVCIN